jgi:hypothetical protein
VGWEKELSSAVVFSWVENFPHSAPQQNLINFWRQIELMRKGEQIKKNKGRLRFPSGSAIPVGERKVYFLHSGGIPLTKQYQHQPGKV